MAAPYRLSVLVVDDYPDCADSTADLLRLCGHTVAVARTAREAVAAAAADPPDAAVLDLRLPDSDGWQVARRLRAGGGGRRLLLVAVTGCETGEDRWRSLEAGIDLHLVKPADPGLLAGVLERFGRAVAADGKNTPAG